MVKKRTLSRADSMNTECITTYLGINSLWKYSYFTQASFNQKESEVYVRFHMCGDTSPQYAYLVLWIHPLLSLLKFIPSCMDFPDRMLQKIFLKWFVRSFFFKPRKKVCCKENNATDLLYFPENFLLLWTHFPFVGLRFQLCLVQKEEGESSALCRRCWKLSG